MTGPTGPTSFNREPLWWIAAGQGIIQAVFVLLASFNVPITSAQQAAITGLFIVVGTAWGRSKVFAPVDKAGNPVMVTLKPQDEYSAIAAEVHGEPIETKNVPFVDPVVARGEVEDLAAMIRRDEEFKKRLNKK